MSSEIFRRFYPCEGSEPSQGFPVKAASLNFLIDFIFINVYIEAV